MSPRAPSLESLPKPRVTEGARALLSVRANVIVAFLAGPYAAVLMSLINSHRLGRARRDSAIYAGLAVTWTACLLWLCADGSIGGGINEILLGTTTARFASRIVGIAFSALLYLRLRGSYIARKTAGAKYASPWSDGMFVMALSALASILVAKIGLMIFPSVAW